MTPGNCRSGSDQRGEAVREVDSATLLAGAREIAIRHGDEIYRLRHTRNGKLILTK